MMPLQQYKRIPEAADAGQFEFCGIPVPDCKTDTLASVVIERYPQLWRRAYTKHYDAPGVYRSMKYVAVQFAMGELGLAYNKATGSEMVSNVPVLFKLLEEYDWPTYHVHASMFAAMRRTHPPQGKTWNDVALPYPATIFMLPKGALYMPKLSILDDSERIPIVYVGIARISRARFKFRSEYGEPDGMDRMCVFWSADTPSGPVSHDCCFPMSQALEPDPDWINAATCKQEEDGFDSETVVDARYTSALAGVLANLLLLRSARPEYVEAGAATKKKLGSGTRVHLPTFIGRRYVVRVDRGAGSSSGRHFTEIGWRAGAWKDQPHGPARTLRKSIWVEPYMAHVRGLVAGERAGDVPAAPEQSQN